MHYKEIHIKSPITTKSVDQLIDEIKACNTSLLILNFGEHNFESVEVMKEMKSGLTDEIKSQSHIRKIAFLIPPGFMNESTDENLYRYFSKKAEAVEWLIL
jgi:hypothetical protein